MATPTVPAAGQVLRDAGIRIGAHELYCEGDLVCVRVQGTVRGEESREILERCRQVHEAHGRLYILFDNTAAGSVDQDARRLFVDWVRHHPIAGVANFGGGVVQRTVALLLMNAIRIMDNKATPQTYVATEAEARDWLAALRRQPP